MFGKRNSLACIAVYVHGCDLARRRSVTSFRVAHFMRKAEKCFANANYVRVDIDERPCATLNHPCIIRP